MKPQNSYKLSIEGLSPLFIGSGNTYSQLDYISAEGKIHILDFDKILSQVPEELIDDLTNDINQNFWNNRWQGNVEEFLNKYEINWRDFIEKSYELRGEIRDNEINQFIKTGDLIYIPGSSIKGAIRTAILFDILDKHPREKERINQRILYNFNHREIIKLIQSDGKTDLLRALIVTDQKLKNSLSSIKVDETTVYHLRNKQPTVPIFNEVLDKGFQSEGAIKINRKLVDSGKLISIHFDLRAENLIKAINSFSKTIIAYELRTFKEQYDFNLEELIKFYEDLQTKIISLSDNECVLRLGQGSSVLGITLFLNFSDNKEAVRKFKGLEIIRFDLPDRRNPKNAVAKQGRILILVDRNSRNRPHINETWLCSVKSIRGRSKYVSLLERITPSFDIEKRGDLLYPLTRKLVISADNKLLFPFGWIKLTWE